MKPSFILHLDSLEILDELTQPQKAQLFDAIRDYNLGKEPKLSETLKMVFIPFRNQFKRDLVKWENKCITNRDNGSKGGKQKVANASERNRTVANLADKDNVKDKDSVKSKEEVMSWFTQWASDSNLIKSKVLNKVETAYMTYEANNWCDKNNKPIKDIIVSIRAWFNDLDEYKLGKPPMDTVINACTGLTGSMKHLTDQGYSEEFIQQVYKDYKDSCVTKLEHP